MKKSAHGICYALRDSGAELTHSQRGLDHILAENASAKEI